MSGHRQIRVPLGASILGLLAASAVAFAGPLTHASAKTRTTAKPVGTLIMVSGVISDRHAGAKRATRVRSGAKVELGDQITPAKGASARIVFTTAAKKITGTLFTLQAPTAATQQIQTGAAKLGPRLAFVHAGRDIATVVGPGLDAATKITAVKSAGAGAVRVTFSAPTDKGSPFACSVDGGAFKTCRSPETLHVKTGQHTIAVRSTSLYGFHSAAVSRSFSVGG